MTMRERIARVAYDEAFPQVAWEIAGDHRQQFFLDQADAVLAAMREPTEAMVTAGYDVGYSPDPLPCGDVWKAMIDAAISEGKP